VLVNLLSNAVKYSHKIPEPQIVIGSQNDEENGMITVFVRDNGAGFDLQYANKLFQVFQRLHRVNDFEGTGIGLAIVRRIVERHGGTGMGGGDRRPRRNLLFLATNQEAKSWTNSDTFCWQMTTRMTWSWRRAL
jgi:K+-sensing histidine kinase KdpD